MPNKLKGPHSATTTHSSSTDEQLLVALAEGERTALDQLFLRHSGKVLSFAQKKGFSPEKAEDIVQIVFMQLWRKKHLYDEKYQALAWIFVITKSEMRDLVLKEKSHRNIDDSSEVLSQIPDQSPNIEETTANQQILEVAMAGLKTKEKQVVQMKWLDELDYPEIAQRLQESESNIRQIASRALKTLRTVLRKET